MTDLTLGDPSFGGTRGTGLVTGSYLHPPIGGGTPPIDVNTHPQTVLPHWGCVYCLVVYLYTA